MAKQAVSCPNCQKPAIKEGSVITCEHCDAQYEFHQTGNRLSSVGKLDDHEARLQALEGRDKPAESEPAAGEPEAGESKPAGGINITIDNED